MPASVLARWGQGAAAAAELAVLAVTFGSAGLLVGVAHQGGRDEFVPIGDLVVLESLRGARGCAGPICTAAGRYFLARTAWLLTLL